MIGNPALDQWLRDKTAQRRTQHAIEDFARRWNAGAVHRRFDAAAAALDGAAPREAEAAIRRLLEESEWLDGLVAGLADRLASDPFFEPPFPPVSSDIHAGLLVFQDPRMQVAAGIVDVVRLAARKNGPRGSTSVGFSGRLSVLKFVRAGGARLSFWEAPPIGAGFTAAKAGRCVRTGERRIRDGEIVTIDGRRQSFVIEHARANLTIVQADLLLGQAPLSVEYDSASGEYVGCSAADDSASRIQMIATLLRTLDHEAAVPALAAHLGHPHFFVRWHVMRELLGLDAEAALPHLRRMAARDPHAETRHAARAVLDRLEAPPARRRAA